MLRNNTNDAPMRNVVHCHIWFCPSAFTRQTNLRCGAAKRDGPAADRKAHIVGTLEVVEQWFKASCFEVGVVPDNPARVELEAVPTEKNGEGFGSNLLTDLRDGGQGTQGLDVRGIGRGDHDGGILQNEKPPDLVSDFGRKR